MKTNHPALYQHLLNYLQEHHYHVLHVCRQERKSTVAVLSFLGQKEKIEIPAFPPKTGASHEYSFKEPMSPLGGSAWFSYLLFLGRCTLGETGDTALCLPDAPKSRQIIEGLQPYFTRIGIRRKIYLVSENGHISICKLNEVGS